MLSCLETKGVTERGAPGPRRCQGPGPLPQSCPEPEGVGGRASCDSAPRLLALHLSPSENHSLTAPPAVGCSLPHRCCSLLGQPRMPYQWNRLVLTPQNEFPPGSAPTRHAGYLAPAPVWPSVPAFVLLPTCLPRSVSLLSGTLAGVSVPTGEGPRPELTLRAGQRRGRRALEGWVGWLAGECREGLAPRRMALGGRWQRRWPEPLQWADHGREEAGSQPGGNRQL